MGAVNQWTVGDEGPVGKHHSGFAAISLHHSGGRNKGFDGVMSTLLGDNNLVITHHVIFFSSSDNHIKTISIIKLFTGW